MNKLLTETKLEFGEFSGVGDIGKVEGNGVPQFAKFISTIIGVLTVVGIVWFIIQFMSGALGIITSGGDKAGLESAKKKITTSLIGLVVVLIAVVLIRLVGSFIGVDFLNFGNLYNSLLGQ